MTSPPGNDEDHAPPYPKPRLRSPGDASGWPLWRVEVYGSLLESASRSIGVVAEPRGPYAGETIRLPHLDWCVWVAQDENGDTVRFVHPPGYLIDASGFTSFGYYAFDRDAECLRWTPADHESRV